jgi:hypothetical protein
MSGSRFRWALLALLAAAIALAAGLLRRQAPLDAIDAASEAALEDVLGGGNAAP